MNQPKVMIVASRGRGEHNEQVLEPRTDGCTNTITSVQKDNYVAILDANSALVQPKDRDYKKHGVSRETHLEVKDDGVCHNLRTGGQTLVVERVAVVDDIYKNREPRVYEKYAPTLRAYHAGDLKVIRIRTANKQGYDTARGGGWNRSSIPNKHDS